MTDPINPYDPANADQLSMFGTDDIAYAKQQHRKRKAKEAPPIVLPDGPCCGRCDFWRGPEERGGFGVCRALGVTTDRSAEVEKGVVMPVDELIRIATAEWDYLNTKAHFGAASEEGDRACLLYLAQREAAA